MITFPDIDPVALTLGPLSIRWYALAYVGGVLLGYRYVVHLCRRHGPTFSAAARDQLVLYAILGIMLGGRLGYVLAYQPGYFFHQPLHIFMLWQGGMSFHGGMLGVIMAFALFAQRHGLGYLSLMDRIACAAPIGLFFGRLANFINGELFGRVSDAPWAMIFPRGGDAPRHPSQLYEAGLEGLVLGLLLYMLQRFSRAIHSPGVLSGIFLLGYGLARSICELFREPDMQLGFIAGGLTMGQILCLPMMLAGAVLLWRARSPQPPPAR